MTYPRSHLVDPDGGIYHVCSRCVRRAFLCGVDHLTGHNFDHRRQWIEDRLLELAKIFAIEIYAYAVMSNHYHIVLRLDPARISNWSDQEVVGKWLSLNPHKGDNEITLMARKLAILEDNEFLTKIRHRLGSLSWMMRYLNEPLARLANKEDGCKGRFWEGRFKSQRLLDETAILACMVYVDLNPVRAKLTNNVAKAKHTSLAKRIASKHPPDNVPMGSVSDPDRLLPFSITLERYIELANWTIEAQQPNQRLNPPLQSLPAQELWIKQFLPKPGCWSRALGSVQSIKDYAKDIGQCWIKTNPVSL